MSQLLHETYSKLFVVIGQNAQVSKFIYKISHENVMYNTVTIVNNTVLHILKLINLKFSKQEKNVTMYGDGR